MSDEYSEILDLKDFEEEKPLVIDDSEKKFLSEYLKGKSLEESADEAQIDYSYAVKLITCPDVREMVKKFRKNLEQASEVQKREGIDILSEMIRMRPMEYMNSAGEWDIEKLKRDNVPVKSIEPKYDKDGCLQGHKITFHDHLNAFKAVSDVRGWNSPKKVEHSGTVGGLTPEMLKRIDEVVVDAEIIEEETDEDEIKRLLG